MKNYDELKLMASNEFGWGKFVKEYLSLLKKYVDPKSIILDAGCGDGGIFAKSGLNKKFMRKSLIGVDIGNEKNQYVDKKLVSNLETLPFDNETFDIIICEMVIEHLKNPKKVFDEFARVLKTNSVLVLITPNILNPLVMFSKVIPNSIKDLC